MAEPATRREGDDRGGPPDGAASAPVGPQGGGRLDRAAFGELFQAHARSLWVLACGVTGRRDEADDVLQEAAMIALGKLDQFEPGTRFGAWMGRIVRWSALNRARKRRRRGELGDPELLLALQPDPAPAPDPGVDAAGQLLEQADLDDAWTRALERLRPTPRACLLLKVVLELDYDAISEVLGVPAGTAMSHVHRSRARLREWLAPDGEVPTPDTSGAPGSARDVGDATGGAAR